MKRTTKTQLRYIFDSRNIMYPSSTGAPDRMISHRIVPI